MPSCAVRDKVEGVTLVDSGSCRRYCTLASIACFASRATCFGCAQGKAILWKGDADIFVWLERADAFMNGVRQ